MRFQLETLGSPPSRWKCVRNKTLFNEIDDRSEDGSEDLLTVSHLTGVTRRVEKDVYMFMAESLEGYKRCRPGGLVINTMWAWMGALGISPLSGIVSPSYHVYRLAQPDVDPRYFDYLFRTTAYVAEITRNSRGVWTSRLRLYPDVFLDMESLLPPPDEQKAIADFLDRKTAAIDALIEKKERLVALLAEKRAALIHRAVTRGPDPDTPLKDSGVPWIGEIPAHWEVTRLKHVCQFITSGPRGWGQHYADNGAVFLRIGNVARESINLKLGYNDIQRVDPPRGTEGARTLAHPDDILITITADIGSVGVVPKGLGEAYVSQHVAICRPIAHAVNPRFLAYCGKSGWGAHHFDERMQGGTKLGLTLDDVRNMRFGAAPPAEQDRIVQHLDGAEKRLSSAQRNLEIQIAKLHEYRQSLITAAVTGQIDVGGQT